MELPDVVSLASHAAHSSAGMSGLAYVASGDEEDKASLSLLTCGADGALSSRPMGDADAALPDATSISTGTSLTPLTCLAASRGVFAVGDESNYVRVRLHLERERESQRKEAGERESLTRSILIRATPERRSSPSSRPRTFETLRLSSKLSTALLPPLVRIRRRRHPLRAPAALSGLLPGRLHPRRGRGRRGH